jgi:hypothetical protein
MAYVDLDTGRFVSFSDLRDANEAVIDAARSEVAAISRQLQAGEISLDEWQVKMMADIKTINILSAAEANGGWYEMSQADWGAVGHIIRDQYKYLDNFGTQIFNGEQPLNGNFLRRADLYAQAGRGTYEQMVRRWQQLDNAMEEERRVLGPADHCPGCLEQASRSWQPIGSLDPIGDEECSQNCHCYFEYRRLGPDGEYIYAEA